MPRSKKVDSSGDPSVDKTVLSRLQGKYGGDRKSPNGLVVDWSKVDPHLMFQLVYAVAKRKGAVMFGSDKSGGGYTLIVFVGGERVLNQWYRGDDTGVELMHVTMEEFLQDLELLAIELDGSG